MGEKQELLNIEKEKLNIHMHAYIHTYITHHRYEEDGEDICKGEKQELLNIEPTKFNAEGRLLSEWLMDDDTCRAEYCECSELL
jgi:hypothetical protein